MNYKNIILLCIILIILLYIFITKNLATYRQDYIFIIISILILSITFIELQKKYIENFDSDDNKQIISNKNSEKKIFINNENIELLGNKLVVYLTSYSKESYDNGIYWNNIASFTTNPNNFTFTKEPILTSLNEIKMQSNSLSGPFSMNLGIDMNKDFTIFMNIKLTPFNTSQQTFKLFELYATKDNIGLYASIIKDDNNELFIKISSAFTKDLYYKLSNIQFSIFDNQYHLITIVKNSEFIKLYIDNYLDNTNNLPASIEVQVFNNKFSNATTKLLDNTTNNIISYITHFGIYNKALTINKGVHEITTLYDYIKNIELKQSSLYTSLLTDFNNLKDSIKLSKENPFNSDSINNKCSMITDWSNFDNIIINADDNCLKSINDYCITDKNFEQCKIWNSFQKIAPYFTSKNKPIDLIDISLDNESSIDLLKNNVLTNNTSNNTSNNQNTDTDIDNTIKSYKTKILDIDWSLNL